MRAAGCYEDKDGEGFDGVYGHTRFEGLVEFQPEGLKKVRGGGLDEACSDVEGRHFA